MKVIVLWQDLPTLKTYLKKIRKTRETGDLEAVTDEDPNIETGHRIF